MCSSAFAMGSSTFKLVTVVIVVELYYGWTGLEKGIYCRCPVFGQTLYQVSVSISCQCRVIKLTYRAPVQRLLSALSAPLSFGCPMHHPHLFQQFLMPCQACGPFDDGDCSP